MELLFLLVLVLAVFVTACVVYYGLSGRCEAKIVRYRREVDALEIENRKLRHEINVLNEKNAALQELRKKELELDRMTLTQADYEDLDPKDVLAELLRMRAITAADMERVNKYQKDTKSAAPADELMVILDIIPNETLAKGKQAAALRRKRAAMAA